MAMSTETAITVQGWLMLRLTSATITALSMPLFFLVKSQYSAARALSER
jgi:hypothetical protein